MTDQKTCRQCGAFMPIGAPSLYCEACDDESVCEHYHGHDGECDQRPEVASSAAPNAVAALILSADDPKVTGIRRRRRP